ncbi:hypothetical protein [Gordonia alkanivorans]|uniref:hypothetical protein n=1 Tax=Gordonia alkanivorans TaxID=84096 RepID=UPI00244D6A16|nr:hypothetical protein [Gordonia alkanivorans]MDH3010314.1 hypothetical protein [Gordonia alkanivorans]MDJ0026936.1 hypothetical protein [Gordonia alkanivorans]
MQSTLNRPPEPPNPAFPDDFIPVGAPTGTRPGLRASLLAWAGNLVAVVAFVAAGLLIIVAFGRALAEQGAAGYAWTAVGVYVVGVLATLGSTVGLTVSFCRRLADDELRRPGPIVDLVALVIVTANNVFAAIFPFVFILASR